MLNLLTINECKNIPVEFIIEIIKDPDDRDMLYSIFKVL